MDRAEFTLSRPVCLSLPVEEVDKLFTQRFDALVESLELGKPPSGSGPAGHRGNGRNKRHLH